MAAIVAGADAELGLPVGAFGPLRGTNVEQLGVNRPVVEAKREVERWTTAAQKRRRRRIEASYEQTGRKSRNGSDLCVSLPTLWRSKRSAGGDWIRRPRGPVHHIGIA